VSSEGHIDPLLFWRIKLRIRKWGFQIVPDVFYGSFNLFSNLELSYLNEYDFVIVGSGPGGCVLANRLTENRNWNVLLIEAGKVETFVQNIPLLSGNQQLTQYDWQYKAEHQEGSCMGDLVLN
jgi:hypothetical protein